MTSTLAPSTALINIEIEEDTDYTLKINYTEPSTGLPIDLTNYTAELYVDAGLGDAGSMITLTTAGGQIVLSGASGVITLTIVSASSRGLGMFKGFYNLYLTRTTPTVERTKISKGFFIVSPSVLL